MNFKVIGLKTAESFLKLKTKEALELAGLGAEKSAEHLRNEVKMSIAGHRPEPTSVDTGRFLNSVDIVKNGLNSIIFTKVPYAKFLEYGTSRLPARSHFTNSAARNKSKVRNIIQSEINKI